MEKIYLQGKYKDLYAKVEDKHFDLLSRQKWYAKKQSNNFYAVTYVRTNIKFSDKKWKFCGIKMHQLIMPSRPNLVIDHIDGDGLNNQESNLRYASWEHNGHNKKKSVGTSSIYKGVHFHKLCHKWLVKITVRKKQLYLGLYADEKEAAIQYDNAAKKYFGEYARINFPQL